MARDPGHPDGSGQMRLAGARPADQHDVVRVVSKVGGDQGADELAVDR